MASPRQPRLPNAPVYQPVGLAGGLDTKTDPKLVQSPKTLQATNVRYGVSGAVRKRAGTTLLGTQPSLLAVLATQQELLCADTANLYAVNVGNGTFTAKGGVGAALISAQNLVTIGNLLSRTLRTIQCEYTGNTGLLVWEFGPTNIAAIGSTLGTPGNMDQGGTIYLTLFNPATGAAIWTTSTIGTALSFSSYTMLNPAGSYSITPGLTPSGAAHPVLAVASNFYYLTYISIVPGSRVVDGSTTINGNLYATTTVTINPSSLTAPNLGLNVISNASYIFPSVAVFGSSPTNPAVTTANYGQTFSIPLFFDMRAFNNDVLIYVNGQNYSLPTGSGTPYTAVTYRAAAAYVIGIRSSTTTSTVRIQTLTFPGGLGPCTMCAGTGIWGVTSYNRLATMFLFPNFGNGTCAQSAISQQVSGPIDTMSLPFSNMFTPDPTLPFQIFITDGWQAGYFPISYGTFNVITTAFPGTLATYYPTVDYSSQNNYQLGGQLASRLFLFQGSPCAWTIQATNLRSTLADLVLQFFNLGVPSTYALAHAAYNRVATLGVPTDASTTVPFLPYPRQACNVTYPPSTSPLDTRNPVTAYISNINAQENTLSIRSLAVGADQSVTPLVSYGSSRNWVPTPQGVLLLGADPKYYDGATCRTLGFLKVPELITSPGSSGLVQANTLTNYFGNYYGPGSGLTQGQTYTFFLVYVDYDNSGNVIYSSPSPPIVVTVPTTPPATAFVMIFPTSGFFSAVPTRGALQVYRNTVANPLQYVKTKQFSLPWRAGDPGTALRGSSQVFVDDTGNLLLDEKLTGPLLYAPPSGGELPNDPPPASTIGVSNKSRIFLVSQENPSWVYFSKPFFPGRAPEFNVGQFLDIDPTTGPITGIAIMDTTVVVFKEKQIYIFGGEGPDATGSGAFSPTQQIASDVGCIDPSSVLTTEMGVWFRSRRGLQLLNRGYAVAYPGADVEGVLTRDVAVVEAVLVPNDNQIRFSLSSGDVLVYDTMNGVWSRFVYLRTSGATTVISSSVIFQGIPYSVADDGRLRYEASSQDAVDVIGPGTAVNYPMTIQTPWINVAGPQGWGRVRRVSVLGKWNQSHTMSLSFSYDFDNATAYTIPYNAETASQTIPYNWRVRSPRQVCQAVRLTLTDNATGGDGAQITGLVLELGPKSGALRVADNRSV